MAMDFPNSPTAGQSFTSGGTTWVWTVPPSAWKATAGPSGGASYLPITGGQLNPGGLLIGTAGSVPAGAGLMINAAASAPAVAVPIPAGVSIIGDAGGEARVFLDSYSGAGGAITPGLYARKARGTAAAPTAVQTNDALFVVDCSGRGATGYGPSASTYLAVAAENWSDTAQGTYTAFYTTNLGTTTAVQRMFLRQGLIVGPLATPDPGPGALTLNANTVAPQPYGGGGTPSLWAVGANATNPLEIIDTYGGVGQFLFRTAGGTAAAPMGLGANAFIAVVDFSGRTSAGTYQTTNPMARISVQASETLTGTAQGSILNLATCITGTTSLVNSLTLAGNSATFSGTVSANGGMSITLPSGQAAWFSATVASARNWQFGTNSNGEYTIVDQTGSNTRRFVIAVDGTTYNTTGTWSSLSDARAKTGVEAYTPGLQAILALSPIRYDLDTDDWKGEGLVGFRAEEVAKVLPELCGTATAKLKGKDTELQTVAPTGVVFALCNAIKELKAEIDDLKIQLSKKA